MTEKRLNELKRAFIDAPITLETKIIDIWMMAAKYADTHPAKEEEPSVLDEYILEYMREHKNFFRSKAVYTRAKNVLKVLDIETFRDIIKFGKRSIANCRNCGKLCIEGYEKILASVGLSFETQV